MPVPGAVVDPAAVSEATVELDRPDGRVHAYVARPARAAPRGGVVVVHEAFGLVDHIRDVARRFANAGFDAIAPDLYSREGAPDPTDMGSVGATMFAVPDDRAVSDLEAAARYLRDLDGAAGGVGSIGFCSGGRHSLLFACSSNLVDAAVDCWGGFIDRATPDQSVIPQRPVPVVDLLGRLSCPVLLVGGAEDENPSPSVLRFAEQRALEAGKDVRVEVFDGAGHAFFADYRPSYRDGPAQRLWAMVIGYFEGLLVHGAN